VSAAPLPAGDRPALLRWQRTALLVGAGALAICVLAALISQPLRVQFFRSYLVAFTLCLGLGVGSLAILMLQYVTGGTWGFILRRPLEAGTRTLPLLALLFVPLAFGLPDLYDWAKSADQIEGLHNKHLSHQIEHLRPFLNVPFFLARAAGYFLVWLVLAWLLNLWSRRHDASGDQRLEENAQALSAPGLVLFALTVTFVSIDWVMSLEPMWYSTIFGGLFGMGQVLSAYAFCVAVLALLGDSPPLDRVMARENLRDLGSLLLAFVMVWAYLAFSQFLLIWSGNLPEETPWYLARLRGGWSVVALALVLLHFALPFVLLLMADLKRNRKALAGVALLVLAMRVVDVFWLIVPAYQPKAGFTVHPLDLAALLGVGGLWLGVFLWQVRSRPLLPLHAPVAEEAHHHG
jgi:hypothetical protein